MTDESHFPECPVHEIPMESAGFESGVLGGDDGGATQLWECPRSDCDQKYPPAEPLMPLT